MIFADKLINLRKKSGWTQEELAEKMDVSRQSIAKWEGAQSVPELAKIIKLSELFGVTTDYLLKDSIETPDRATEAKDSDDTSLRRVSMEEANSFLLARKKAALPTALATALCIISPITLILLSCLSEVPDVGLSENMAAGTGLIVLIILVATAVATYISVGNKNAQYQYLEKEIIDTEYGVDGLVNELRNQFKPIYNRCIIIGVVLCILAVLPIFAGIMIADKNPAIMDAMVCLLLLFIAVGVFLFVRVGVVWASYEKLLQDGAYSVEKKKENNSLVGLTSGAYWLIATAIYLAVSFLKNNWESSWIIWPIAGVLYPVVLMIARAAVKKDK